MNPLIIHKGDIINVKKSCEWRIANPDFKNAYELSLLIDDFDTDIRCCLYQVDKAILIYKIDMIVILNFPKKEGQKVLSKLKDRFPYVSQKIEPVY